MTAPSFPSNALGQIRLSDALQRGLPYGLAISLHAALVTLFLSTPPGELLQIRGEVERLDVRFYTVSAADAQSDAQLVEPPLVEEEVAANEVPAPVIEAESEPEPLQPQPVEPEEVEEPNEAEETTALAASEDGRDTAPPNTVAPVRQTESTTASSRSALSGSSAPVRTTQIRPSAQRAASPPPSFADILARVETRLDPDDFRIVLSASGTRGAVRESLCLSSSAANLEAGDCPDGPNAASAELAHYGLQGPGEEPPEFLVDLDRMEFQLRQMGANPSQVERIMLALRESRREAINTPGVNRAMQRDLNSRTDNLGNPISDP